MIRIGDGIKMCFANTWSQVQAKLFGKIEYTSLEAQPTKP